MYEFIFLVAIDNSLEIIQYSSIEVQQLLADYEGIEQEKLDNFIKKSNCGDYLILGYNKLLLHCNPTTNEIDPPPAQPLINVLKNAGLLE